MNQKFLPEENWKNLSIFDIIILKKSIFPNKKPFSFFNNTVERYDIELTNIKISDWNIVLPDSVQPPEQGSYFNCYFEILLILVQNAESAKNFKVQNFIVSGNKHHSLTRKIGFFRVIS